MAQYRYDRRLGTCRHCGLGIWHKDVELGRVSHNALHAGACEQAWLTRAIHRNRRTLQEDDLLPSERRDVLHGLRDLEAQAHACGFSV